MRSSLTVNSMCTSTLDHLHGIFTKMDKKLLKTLLVIFGTMFSAAAFSLPVPAAADLGFAIYDVVVNDILNGPIGFVGGVLLIVFGAVNITKSWMLAVACVISGSAVIQADTIVTSLGLPIGLI